MKAFNGYEPKYQAGGNTFEPLPAGAYVGRIYGAKADDQALTIQVDVVEGEYNQYFHKRFEADKDSPYGQKYKGTFRLSIPTGDSNDDWKIRSFNSAIGAIELSNTGYKWDWNEGGLKGKAIGLNVREREWEMNGNVGVTTEIGALVPVEDVKTGKVKPMKRRALKGGSSANTSASGYMDVNVEDIPF